MLITIHDLHGFSLPLKALVLRTKLFKTNHLIFKNCDDFSVARNFYFNDLGVRL